MPTATGQRLLGWTNPGVPSSTSEATWKTANLVKVDSLPGVKTVWVNRRVRVVFNALLLVLQASGAKLAKNVDDWGFANRPIRGSTSSSYHRFGLAVDLDATENPMGPHRTTFSTAVARRAVHLLGLRWGYDYEGTRKDAMHFEFCGSAIRAAYLTRRLRKPTKRSRALAELAGMDVAEFVGRINGARP